MIHDTITEKHYLNWQFSNFIDKFMKKLVKFGRTEYCSISSSTGVISSLQSSNFLRNVILAIRVFFINRSSRRSALVFRTHLLCEPIQLGFVSHFRTLILKSCKKRTSLPILKLYFHSVSQKYPSFLGSLWYPYVFHEYCKRSVWTPSFFSRTFFHSTVYYLGSKMFLLPYRDERYSIITLALIVYCNILFDNKT